MSIAMNKHGIEVRKGQVWKDCDKRQEGRYLKVLEVCQYPYEGLVKCMRCTSVGSPIVGNTRILKIRIDRMHKHATGYDLHKDAPAVAYADTVEG